VRTFRIRMALTAAFVKPVTDLPAGPPRQLRETLPDVPTLAVTPPNGRRPPVLAGVTLDTIRTICAGVLLFPSGTMRFTGAAVAPPRLTVPKRGFVRAAFAQPPPMEV
jgi:hypothetical protein